MENEDLRTLLFEDDGRIPNHPTLPLLIYSGVLPPSDTPSSACRQRFERHGWGGSWVNGVYDYHHFHSTAHEVLGVVVGSATIQFGGASGEMVDVRAGDVVVIPAGVGHCNLGQSDDFRVVGAYPRGQEKWDLCVGKTGERPRVLDNIRRVSLPVTDPVYGTDGPLLRLWLKP